MSPLIYTPRLLRALWSTLAYAGPLDPDTRTALEPAFIAHYTAPDPAPTFSWTDPATGAGFVYDVTVNAVQRTPEAADARAHLDAVNRQLRLTLPPDLLEPRADWMPAWYEAVQYARVPAMQFILEQGMDVNRRLPSGHYPLFYAVAPFGGSPEAVRLLLAAGADLTLPENDPEALIAECERHVTAAGEVGYAQEIARLLRRQS